MPRPLPTNQQLRLLSLSRSGLYREHNRAASKTTGQKCAHGKAITSSRRYKATLTFAAAIAAVFFFDGGLPLTLPVAAGLSLIRIKHVLQCKLHNDPDS